MRPNTETILEPSKIVSHFVSHHPFHNPNSFLHMQLELEARVGIEPTNAAFAEPCLTTWLPRRRANGRLGTPRDHARFCFAAVCSDRRKPFIVLLRYQRIRRTNSLENILEARAPHRKE